MALLEHEESGEPLCPKEQLLLLAARRCEQSFRPFEEHLLAKQAGTPMRCAAYQQMNTLLTEALVTERQRKKLCQSGVVFELTAAGRERASQLRTQGEGCASQPLKSHRRVEPGEEGVVLLLVDEHEGGGSHRGPTWHSLMQALEREEVRFETRWLPPGTADYMFVVADRPADGGPTRETPLPIIIERKSAGDVPSSLKVDYATGKSRWYRQQAAMQRRSADVFGGHAALEYILEGVYDADGEILRRETHAVCPSCAAGVGGDRARMGVGGCPQSGWPRRDRVVAAVEQLTADGYTVTRTRTHIETAAVLRRRQLDEQAAQLGKRWKPGMAVLLEGLVSRADLNGSRATVIDGRVPDRERLVVRVGGSTGTVLSVKPANLRLVRATDAPAAPSSSHRAPSVAPPHGALNSSSTAAAAAARCMARSGAPSDPPSGVPSDHAPQSARGTAVSFPRTVSLSGAASAAAEHIDLDSDSDEATARDSEPTAPPTAPPSVPPPTAPASARAPALAAAPSSPADSSCSCSPAADSAAGESAPTGEPTGQRGKGSDGPSPLADPSGGKRRARPRMPTMPTKAEGVSKERAFPDERTGGYALLIAAHRHALQLGVAPTQCGLTKAELMDLADSCVQGKLAYQSLYERTGTGLHTTYDGWSNMKGLLSKPPPWRPLFSKYTEKKPTVEKFVLTEAGAAAAARLHAEAELCGHCRCGLVRKATLAQPGRPADPETGLPKDKGERMKVPLGLHSERLATVRQMLHPGARLEYEESLARWEGEVRAYQAELLEWKEAQAHGQLEGLAARVRKKASSARRPSAEDDAADTADVADAPVRATAANESAQEAVSMGERPAAAAGVDEGYEDASPGRRRKRFRPSFGPAVTEWVADDHSDGRSVEEQCEGVGVKDSVADDHSDGRSVEEPVCKRRTGLDGGGDDVMGVGVSGGSASDGGDGCSTGGDSSQRARGGGVSAPVAAAIDLCSSDEERAVTDHAPYERACAFASQTSSHIAPDASTPVATQVSRSDSSSTSGVESLASSQANSHGGWQPLSSRDVAEARPQAWPELSSQDTVTTVPIQVSAVAIPAVPTAPSRASKEASSARRPSAEDDAADTADVADAPVRATAANESAQEAVSMGERPAAAAGVDEGYEDASPGRRRKRFRPSFGPAVTEWVADDHSDGRSVEEQCEGVGVKDSVADDHSDGRSVEEPVCKRRTGLDGGGDDVMGVGVSGGSASDGGDGCSTGGDSSQRARGGGVSAPVAAAIDLCSSDEERAVTDHAPYERACAFASQTSSHIAPDASTPVATQVSRSDSSSTSGVESLASSQANSHGGWQPLSSRDVAEARPQARPWLSWQDAVAMPAVPVAATAIWECMLQGRYVPYEENVQAVLEDAFQRGLHSATCVIRGQAYEIGPLVAQHAHNAPSCRQRIVVADGMRSRAVRRREL